MTDEELIEMLRAGPEIVYRYVSVDHAAADRIEQLVIETDETHDEAMAAIEMWGAALKGQREADAKLSKAVAALQGVVPYWDKANPLRLADHHHEGHDCDRCKFDHARAVLAELEGKE